MTYRVLLAMGDADLAIELTDMAAESGQFQVLRVVGTAGELMSVLDTVDLDVIVIHEGLGPMPVHDLARELGARVPEVGLVLLARSRSAEMLRTALRAGFRDVATLPLSLEDLSSTLEAAGAWARAVRARMAGADDDPIPALGRMVAVAGAKGGVGTTTVAVHLALAAAAAAAPRSVCLVDFDLQTGDVRSYLDLTHRRSVADLVDVAADLSSQQLNESLSSHSSGLRVLLSPPEGEQAEDVSTEAARLILGGIRSRFDVVVVDCGAVVSDASAVAAEMADQVIVVMTPDVPSMRAANRLLALWERLKVREDGVGILVNRAHRGSEIQPELVSRIVSAPRCRTTIPSDFRALELAANAGDPRRLGAGPVRTAIGRLARELGLVPDTPRQDTPRPSLRLRFSGQAGQVAVETMGMTLTIGLVILLLWEMVLTGFTFMLSGDAAREAAREVAVGHDARLVELVRGRVPSGWKDSARVDAGEDWAEVALSVPLLAPALHSPWRITTRVGTWREVPRSRAQRVNPIPEAPG
jgi:pilus assembly protein CpaE